MQRAVGTLGGFEIVLDQREYVVLEIALAWVEFELPVTPVVDWELAVVAAAVRVLEGEEAIRLLSPPFWDRCPG
jgi:hypothetical protein